MNAGVETPPKTLRLDVVLHNEGGLWVARCVQFAILTSHPNQEQAWADIQELCKAQVLYAAKHDPDLSRLFRPPSSELMKLMATARDEGQVVLSLSRYDHAAADLIWVKKHAA